MTTNYDIFRQFVVQGGEAGREARESGRLKLDWTNNTMRALSNFPVGNFKLLSNIFHQVVALSTSCRCCFTRYSRLQYFALSESQYRCLIARQRHVQPSTNILCSVGYISYSNDKPKCCNNHRLDHRYEHICKWIWYLNVARKITWIFSTEKECYHKTATMVSRKKLIQLLRQ